MGYSADEILRRFTQFAGKPHGYEPGAKPWTTRQRFPEGRGSSLYYVTDSQRRVVEIDSYGRHFPLGRLILTPSGKRRRWLLNGDNWPGSGGWGRTNDHNATLRMLVQESGDPWFIIPFTAVSEAGIELETITPIDVLEERWENIAHSAATLAEVPRRYRSRQVMRDEAGVLIERPTASAWPAGDGTWHVQRQDSSGWHQVPIEGQQYTGQIDWVQEDIEPGEDGRYHWAEERHWLGGSLFRARYTVRDRDWNVTRHWAHFVTAFDENEPRPLWFMSQLPPGFAGKTVAAAIAALKPTVVDLAEATGVPVLRQGDVFAIRGALSTRQLHAMGGVDVTADRDSFRRVLGTNHAATQAITLPNGDTYARGFLRHRPEWGRQPDHRTIKLGDGKTWHLLVRNTVPRSFDGRVDTSGRSRSWSRGGDVD